MVYQIDAPVLNGNILSQPNKEDQGGYQGVLPKTRSEPTEKRAIAPGELDERSKWTDYRLTQQSTQRWGI